MKHNVLAPSVGESITEVGILKWRKANGEAVKTGEILLEIESDKATVEIAADVSGALSITKAEGERVPVGSIIGLIDDAVAGRASTAPISAAPKAAAPAASAPIASTPMASHGPGVRISREAGLAALQNPTPTQVFAIPTVKAPAGPQFKDGPGDRRTPMSSIRKKIAERLVQAQQTAAILTTFNEADMSAVMELRAKYKDSFKAKHGVPLSFMSFFSRACVEALKAVPSVNAFLDGTDIVYHDYVHLGVAVGTERGLVVPVIRDAHRMGFIDLEKKLAELAVKARDGKLSVADLNGGTFTISNGGVYGSLLSTPILNPPQTGILGMHKIQERPVAINGKVEIRPMMYLALSYDHRLIDGKEAVTALVSIKDHIENPKKLGLEFLNDLNA